MNTQTLQHALSQLLHNMQQQMTDLTQAIGDVELRLSATALHKPVHGASAAHTLKAEAKGGGRRSAGWTEAARAQVAARMRDYWRQWREQKACADAEVGADPSAHKNQSKIARGRSTTGWTPQARAQAAARMRARWHGHRQGSGPQEETPCD